MTCWSEKTERDLKSQRMNLSCSVQFSCSVVSDSLQPHGLQHTRLPRLPSPSPTPRACSNLCPSSRWCTQSPHPLSNLSPPAFNRSQHQYFTSGGPSIEASASTSVLPMNIQDWFPLGLTGWISLQSKRLSRIFSNTIQKHQFLSAQPSLWSNSHIHTRLLEKP